MINRVEMSNWRAYDHQEFQFEPGITFIMGPNGKGKTSILEAIAYALTGEPSTVADRGKLLRNPDKLAVVRLHFSVDGQEYVVERSQSFKRAEDAILTRGGSKKAIASSHRRATSEIEQLMRVSSDFLQRIIYMAEGDVFRFLSEPPGEALDLQIRQVLGLTQMDQFLSALEMAEREIKNKRVALQDLSEQTERLKVRDGDALRRQVGALNARREQLLAQLRSIQNEIAQFKRENEDVMRLAPLLNQAQTLSADSEFWHSAQRTPVVQLYNELEQGLTHAQEALQQNQVTQARLEGEQSAYQKILDLLVPYAGRAETLPCPVCGKPMTSGERDKITQDIQSNIQHTQEELASLRAQRTDFTREHDTLRARVSSLRELRNVLAHGTFRSISSESSIANLMESTQSQQTRFQSESRNLEARAKQVEQEIAESEREKSQYLAIEQSLQRLGFDSPEQAREAIVALETRALALRAADRAARETLTRQRNVDMRSIYTQVARAWESFAGQGTWQMELDDAGLPILQDQQGRQLDLSQFSGGEKTALLIILHTIIAHYFSKSDFLLIDEPLEHLDPINRRSLIRFLVEAYNQGMFKQAVIATFEEALVRKYMSNKGVNVIHL